jgi:hypothetical protein
VIVGNEEVAFWGEFSPGSTKISSQDQAALGLRKRKQPTSIQKENKQEGRVNNFKSIHVPKLLVFTYYVDIACS